jgi:hypothetical protein
LAGRFERFLIDLLLGKGGEKYEKTANFKRVGCPGYGSYGWSGFRG